ncbi:MAG: methyltransferase domain-containing protein [Gammaproteobacteria bacterium]
MTTLPFREFDRSYQDAVVSVLKYWTRDMQTEIARHCYDWGPGRTDFTEYLESSSVRYYRAYEVISQNSYGQNVCDIGGLWGVLPLTLKMLGFENVTMTESLKYYSQAYDSLFGYIADNGVRIHDLDPFEGDPQLPQKFDVITVMAVLEHYPHSLKTVMANLIAMLPDSGRLYIEVPNIAYWPKRTDLLLGRSPLANLASIYQSQTPFIGHHHEFTISELRELIRLSGLKVVAEHFYNYSDVRTKSWSQRLRHPVLNLIYTLLRDSREVLAVETTKCR